MATHAERLSEALLSTQDTFGGRKGLVRDGHKPTMAGCAVHVHQRTALVLQ